MHTLAQLVQIAQALERQHHLLSHTAGIRDLSTVAEYSAHLRDPIAFAKQVALIGDDPLLTTPGSQWAYANVNYILLGEVVKKAAGAPFVKYLEEYITRPLSMMDTGMDDSRKGLEHRATGYASDYSLAEYLDLSRVSTAGAMYSTAEDLLRLDQALYGAELVSTGAKTQMFTPHADATFPGYKGGSGYGWFIADIFGHTRIDNGGVINGFKTELHRFPEEKITVIVMVNYDNQQPFTIAESIEQMIFAAP